MTTGEMVRVFGFEVEHFNRPFTGDQWRVDFPNGYGASVIRGPYSYGGPDGKYELGVFHDGGLCYATALTDNVLGHLGKGDVARSLRAIKRLPANTECDHGTTIR